MQRVKRSTAAVALPAPPVGGTPGYFAAPNPQGGPLATVPGYEWYNNVQEEMFAVIEGSGLVASDTDRSQLRQAIQAMVTGAQKAVVVNAATFEASVATGEVVRWDSVNNRFDEAIADGTANNRAVGIADLTNGKVYIYGECPLFSGLTPGARYYLDASTPGALTTVAPTDGVAVGIAKSATTLFVDIDSLGLRADQANTFTKPQTAAALSLTHNTAWDGSSYQNLKAIVNGSAFTVAAASAAPADNTYVGLLVKFTTSHSISFAAGAKGFTGMAAYTPTAAAGGYDHLTFRYDATADRFMLVGVALNVGA